MMGSTLRKLKRHMKATSPLDSKLMEAWNRGFSAGSKQQKETDIEQVMKWLASLEEIPGIGEKRAWEIRRHFLDFFGGLKDSSGDDVK
jgi:hypothetical protein